MLSYCLLEDLILGRGREGGQSGDPVVVQDLPSFTENLASYHHTSAHL